MQSTHRQDLSGMDTWSRHQRLIENYVKHYQTPGENSQQETPHKTERDILVENHRFLRSDQDDEELTWEKRIAKKYYDKLFKEYALVDLRFYKEGRIAMRWRNEKELFRGKGQFSCGNLRCLVSKGLQSWEVNFGYVEQNEKKNALVKIRLCEKCSYKLNYKTQSKRAASPPQNPESSVAESSAAATAPSLYSLRGSRKRSGSRDRSAHDDNGYVDDKERELRDKGATDDSEEERGGRRRRRSHHHDAKDSEVESHDRKMSRRNEEEPGSSESTVGRGHHKRTEARKKRSRSAEHGSGPKESHDETPSKHRGRQESGVKGGVDASETGSSLDRRPQRHTADLDTIFKGLFQ
ncbi:hypothetical protein BGZ99_001558 [Dissophora globulifera]|uniref:Protein FRA10AC1 n=1 Tax=Dissophora globulifera TaxID=979702 RepID=A0A9P6RU82_9FUNG|nr:hypothetical protein BGZ99_001558 [Dissophora globulifera]